MTAVSAAGCGHTISRRHSLLILAQLPPPVHGASQMNHYLVNAPWLRHDYDPILIPLQCSESIGDIGRPRLSKLWRVVHLWRVLVYSCLVKKPAFAYLTLAHTGLAFWRDLTFVTILKTFRIPLVFHIHGKGLGSGTAPRTRRACYRWAFRDAVVIQLSATLYREVEDIVPSPMSRIVPNGIPDTVANGHTRSVRSLEEPVRILFLSNMVPEKGVFELLEAAAILRNAGLAAQTTFAGPFLSDSAQDEFDRAVSQLELCDCVRWVGPAYGNDRRRHLELADIFAFPSYYGPEAFPLAVLEAMAAGLPVVAASTGAISEIVDNMQTGLVIPPRDSRALASALEALIRDAEGRVRMGVAGRRKFEEEYRVERFLAAMRRVFAECSGLRPSESGGDDSAMPDRQEMSADLYATGAGTFR